MYNHFFFNFFQQDFSYQTKSIVSGVPNASRGVYNVSRGVSNVSRGVSNVNRGVFNVNRCRAFGSATVILFEIFTEIIRNNYFLENV